MLTEWQMETVFILVAQTLLRIQNDKETLFMERYQSEFGVNIAITVKLWNHIRESLPDNAQPKHLLWTLYFLKTYPIESVRITFTQTSSKT